MSQSVLVGYASDHGSTRAVAARIAAVLRDHGCSVDLRDLAELEDLDGVDAAVLGSAVHNRAWLPTAVEAVRRHADALAARPVWLFSVGMSDALARPLRSLARKGSERIVDEQRAAVRPRGHQVFSGTIRPEHLPPTGRLFFRLVGGSYGAHEDWPAVVAWADNIATDLDRPAADPHPR